MASKCIQSCIEDVRVPARATYVNLYKWPESDAEFVRRGGQNHPTVVDSVSCRQMYLRSYTFSRKKESVHEKTKKCIGRVRERVVVIHNTSRRKKSKSRSGSGGDDGGGGGGVGLRKRCNCVVMMRKAKDVSCAAFLSMFRRLLFCTTKVDVVDYSHGERC